MFGKLKERIINWKQPKETIPSADLYHLLYGQVENLPSTEDLEIACDLEIAKRPVQVAVVQVGDGSCDPGKLHAIMKYCTEISDSDEVLPVSNGCNQVILLFFRDMLWEEQARDILEDLKKAFLEKWPDTSLCITLGTLEEYVYEGEPSWRKSYQTAIGLQDYRFVKPKGKIIAYSDIVSRRRRYPKGVEFNFDRLKDCLESDNPELHCNWLSEVYKTLSGKGPDTLGLLYHLTLEIVVNAVSLFREKGLTAETYIEKPEVLINEVLNTDTPEDLRRWTDQFLEKCRRSLRQ